MTSWTGRIPTSWAQLWRVVVLLVVLAVVITVALWLVPMTVELGPIKVSRL